MFGTKSDGPGEWNSGRGRDPLPLSETSPFHRRSTCGASQCAAYWYAVHYREAYGLFACNGILFNHESPRQGENSVTRKITRAVGRIKIGLQRELLLADLENVDDYRDWGVRRGLRGGDVVDAAARKTGSGDASKARKVLVWKPKVGFEKFTKMMVDEDVELAKFEEVLVDAGYMDAQQQP
ncbi:hypothetical protein NL676_006422 [Syzygium grande]|nr:hypothetical protein NL676_006422 [Syzygium grande]